MPKKFDLHAHSHYSFDSLNKPSALVDKYRSLGFDGFAITDHGSMNATKPAQEYAKEKNLSLEVISACEFLSDRGEIIGLNIQEMINKKDFGDLCDAIHDQGGVTILPHPFDSKRGSACNPLLLPPELLRLVDGVETINARVINKSDNEKANKWADGHSAIKSAGSDAHLLSECGSAYVEIPDSSSFEIALRKKQTVPCGKTLPFYVHAFSTFAKMGKKIGIIKKPGE